MVRSAGGEGDLGCGALFLETPTLTIPAAELSWRFFAILRAGGQHINTSDSRVSLSWNTTDSPALSDAQRQLLLARLDRRLIAGVVTVTVSEQRSQLRHRETAMARLADWVADGLAPRTCPSPEVQTHPWLHTKKQRSATIQQQRRPPNDEQRQPETPHGESWET